MKRLTGRWYLLVSLILAAVVMPMAAAAEVVYETNTKDSEGYLLRTQPAYYPSGMIGLDLVVPDKDQPDVNVPSPMRNPKDVFIDSRNHIYVADTGNSRVIEFSETGKWLRYITLPESPLNKPEGIFVSDSFDIYIADTGNKRVVRLDKEGKLLKEFGRPVSKYIPEAYKYDPVKLIVDKRGFLYIATLGSYQGLLQLDTEGEFQSFYGANATPFSALDALKRMLYTKQMYANETSKLPGSISSIAVDNDGFVYTTTSGFNVTMGQIKKLNTRGKNILHQDPGSTVTPDNYGVTRPSDLKNMPGAVPQLTDLCIDENGNITMIDATFKYISQFDSAGNLLFFWAGPTSSDTTQLGLIKNPVAIDANSNNDLFILDEQEGVVQIFRLTEFGKKVNEANRLTLQGFYEESEGPWKEVLRLHAAFSPAMGGLAKAAYKRGDYEQALDYFQQSGKRQGYSDAFWQIRLQWFQRHFSMLASAVVIITLLLWLSNLVTRNRSWRQSLRNRQRSAHPAVVQLKHVFYILKHPIDGFTAIRHEARGGYISGFIVLLLAYLGHAFSRLYTSFPFNPVPMHKVNLLGLLGQFLLIWIGWVVSNYLVSSIYRGEGRFKDVCVGSAYALMPLALVGIPLAAISNILTYSELSIYQFLDHGMMVWAALLFFWSIQAIHNYSVGETLMNIALSMFTFIILVILAIIMLGLTNDLFDFIYEVFQEVRLR
ncbi:YIP1 family protein [Paenibacillus eucommiae]|uniref:Sugar lactone lactonase YvrE n=1 Tax=Paenibacillus eucommiae TaxID=1355755 RepID=A0ABS4IW76_9BACL|nr:YIP1 family protein [Paenibacillus eucommiae]MBP1990764.1 sugar lactone lactonase YvrE [Paenibacillus eucommiae]